MKPFTGEKSTTLIKLACGPWMTAHLRSPWWPPTADVLQIILHHAFFARFIHDRRRLSVSAGSMCAASGVDTAGVFRGKRSLSINGMAAEYSESPFRWNGIHIIGMAATVRLDGIRFFPIDDENTEERAFRTRPVTHHKFGAREYAGALPA